MSTEDEQVDQGARLTALVLRDVAMHLEVGHVMAGGAWQQSRHHDRLPGWKRSRSRFARGRHLGRGEAAQALRWIADRNDPPEAKTG